LFDQVVEKKFAKFPKSIRGGGKRAMTTRRAPLSDTSLADELGNADPYKN
jgi:hypothetical protein